MKEAHFITPEMSIVLDGVRVLAALVVLAGHMVNFHLYTGPYPFERSAQHVAVMVFFVLSGLVIAHSVQVRPVTAGEYAAARIARIVPMAVVAVAFSLVISLYGTWIGISFSEPAPSPANVLLPLLFLSESAFGRGLVWNPPFWSLAYEAMYYALFGAAVFAGGRMRWLLVAIVTLIAGMKVLLLLPVWLIGVLLARRGHRWTANLPGGLCLIVLGASVVLVAAEHAAGATRLLCAMLDQPQDQLGFSRQAITDLFAGMGVALCFMGLKPLAQRIGGTLERWRRPIRVAADLSFPVYILHLPILVLLSAYGMHAGLNPLIAAGMLALIIALCAAIAAPVDRRTAGLRASLNRWFARQPLAALQAA